MKISHHIMPKKIMNLQYHQLTKQKPNFQPRNLVMPKNPKTTRKKPDRDSYPKITGEIPPTRMPRNPLGTSPVVPYALPPSDV